MDALLASEPQARRFPLPGRGGEMAGLAFGPAERPLDLLFVHANGFNARTYRTILGPLAEQFHILAVDLRGHGRTSLPTEVEGRPGWKDFRDDLLALMPFVTTGPVVMAGHSMGGTSSLLTAAARPEHVRRLVVFDPVLMPDAVAADPQAAAQSPMVQGALRRRSRFASRDEAIAAYAGRGAFRTWAPEQLADYVADGFMETGEGDVQLSCAPTWEASNFASYDPDAFDALVQAPRPVRILRAETGSTCRIDAHLERVRAAGVRVETVPGTSHFLPMERPDLVREVLTEAILA
ncbi:MAG: alpha/beta hydrolase [Caulobacteraceae bacterium]|nr:alpha/beta hydrolase [Caulobacteraceae bacterium]